MTAREPLDITDLDDEDLRCAGFRRATFGRLSIESEIEREIAAEKALAQPHEDEARPMILFDDGVVDLLREGAGLALDRRAALQDAPGEPERAATAAPAPPPLLHTQDAPPPVLRPSLAALPPYARPRDLTGVVFPVSEAVIRQEAKKAGLGGKMGRTFMLSRADIEQLYEASSPCSRSSKDHARLTGSSGARSKDAASKKVRALLNEDSPKKSAPSARPSFSQKPSTVVAFPQRRRSPKRP